MRDGGEPPQAEAVRADTRLKSGPFCVPVEGDRD
jgi:hypothetical protein